MRWASIALVRSKSARIRSAVVFLLQQLLLMLAFVCSSLLFASLLLPVDKYWVVISNTYTLNYIRNYAKRSYSVFYCDVCAFCSFARTCAENIRSRPMPHGGERERAESCLYTNISEKKGNSVNSCSQCTHLSLSYYIYMHVRCVCCVHAYTG